MGCLGLILVILIALPVIFLLLFLNIITLSFGQLGLSPEAAVTLLLAMVLGSMVNIPISRRRILYEQPRPLYLRFFFYLPPRVRHQVIAVNLGGAVIPVVFALYLLPRSPLLATLEATIVVIVATRLLAKPVPGVGIVMPAWIPPVISAGLALLLARDNPAPVAYISGTLGTLIGADLLNWPNFKKLGAHLISIGGAGVFDGIFLAGIMAVLITSL
ncbi:MAG TPA: DUF1614 domain-containing protein [Dehalococcoidia bacterium]|jgi:uncharacterized membrane protein|nr:DUF1614 domain-containing protein [Dehalococcoidia bacterium]